MPQECWRGSLTTNLIRLRLGACALGVLLTGHGVVGLIKILTDGESTDPHGDIPVGDPE